MDKATLMGREKRRKQAAGLIAKKRATTRKMQAALPFESVPAHSCAYVLRLADGAFKIGGTANLRKRLAEHKSKKKLPPFELFCAVLSNAPLWAERYLHGVFREFRVRSEVFALQPDALAWLSSLGRLDRDNEPTPPAFCEPPEPLPPPAPRYVRVSKVEPPPKAKPPRKTPQPTQHPRRWRRGRFPTVWHP